MAILADGTDVDINDGASNAFAAIPNVIDITPPENMLGKVDATALDSTAGTMINMARSRVDPGELSFRMHYSQTEWDRLVALRGTAKQIRLTYPDADTDTFNGFIASVVKQQLQNQEIVTMEVKFTLTQA